jgi:hypothetical protein
MLKKYFGQNCMNFWEISFVFLNESRMKRIIDVPGQTDDRLTRQDLF